ncbi:MAG: (4Fe-4S)-binding protein [Bacteroidota bacterium]|nr:(4Fe-4S)-binding protein [Bacteroidota bacterium]
MKYILEKPVHGSIGTEKYRCSIEWRNGKFITDEPATSGGKDLGPDPQTLLLSSVASCILATLRMYIDRKNWDIPSITVNVNMYQETINDIISTVIDRDLMMGDSVPDDQKIKLQEIANHCPISKILENDIKLRTFIFKTGDTKTIKYGNEQITVLWKPEFCQHSTRCWKQLPQVFKPSVKKWIDPGGAPAHRINEQVLKCPSGALAFIYNIPEKPEN